MGADDLLGFSGFFRFKSNTLFAANLLAVQPGGQKALTGALVQIGNFFFGLLKGQLDLLLCQGHQILVDALQDEVHICPCHGNAAGQGFFVSLGVDVVLFQEHQPNALMIEIFIQSKAFLCISGHPGHRIEHHRISCFQNPIELKEKKLPSSLNIQRTAGIICIEVFDYDYAQMLCDLDVPLLFVDTPVMDMRPPLKADRLYMENRIEIQNAVAHMVQHGKKRISFAGDKNHCQSFFERYMAYKDAMEHFGLTEGLSTCAMPSGQQNYPVSLYETIRRFKTMPDAFVCANDFVAMDLVKALNELGYSVPDDIWVCGFDDSQEASYFVPRLTSIHIHEQIMGYTAANLLMTRIEEPSLNYRTVYTETNLILRESTGD